MKTIKYILLIISIISWVGLLPLMIEIKTPPCSFEEGFSFAMLVFIMVISVATLSIF